MRWACDRSVVQFKEVFLTPEYLAIAMEYAAGGDMFQYVKQRGGLEEAEARWFFQQLIIGMDYCHKMVRSSRFRPLGQWEGVGIDVVMRCHFCQQQMQQQGLLSQTGKWRPFCRATTSLVGCGDQEDVSSVDTSTHHGSDEW